MRGQKNLIVVSNFTKSKHDATAGFRTDTQSMTKCLSEYQSAYKPLPWQPVQKIMKPTRTKLTKDTVRAQMEKKSVYGVDYACLTKPSRKASPMRHKPELACPKDLMDTKTIYNLEYYKKAAEPQDVTNPAAQKTQLISEKQPFAGDSIYTASYPAYDATTMTACQRSPIKAKDNTEVPPSTQLEKNPKSTAQDDFIHHQNFERPTAIRPVENTQRSSEPLQSNTEYSDFYTNKMKEALLYSKVPEKPVPIKKQIPKQELKTFVAISTAMADFTKPEGFEPQKPCHPPPSNHFVPSPFEGITTFSMAYKPWPVQRQEQPVWAKKPTYKRPVGGFITNSLYMHDFRDPKMPLPPKPIRPNNYGTNLIDGKEGGDTKFEKLTTYNKDFQAWENIAPPQSYHIVEVYKPPTEKMICETNQRAHFKGEPSAKVLPCRHVSQHRELNANQRMTFVTTYNENFVNPRPLSSPSRCPCFKVTSTPTNCQAPPSSPAEKSGEKPFLPIPQPNLEACRAKLEDSSSNKDDKAEDAETTDKEENEKDKD